MGDTARAFEQGATGYQERAETPWARLEIEMIWRQLQRHLPEAGRRVLEAGCGLGQLAIRLARADHDVTAFDFSAGMIAAARERAAHAGATVDWRQLALEEAVAVFASGSFDAVLCHSVLAYVPRPEKVIRDLAGLLRPGGVLSLVAHNPHIGVIRTAVWQRDFAAALAQLEHPTHYSAIFDLHLQLHNAETLKVWMRTAGLKVVARYGIRIINDLITDNALKYDARNFADLLKLEMALCDHSPYRDIAAHSHFVARRV